MFVDTVQTKKALSAVYQIWNIYTFRFRWKFRRFHDSRPWWSSSNFKKNRCFKHTDNVIKRKGLICTHENLSRAPMLPTLQVSFFLLHVGLPQLLGLSSPCLPSMQSLLVSQLLQQSLLLLPHSHFCGHSRFDECHVHSRLDDGHVNSRLDEC